MKQQEQEHFDARALFDESIVACTTLKEAIEAFHDTFCTGDACEVCGCLLKENTGAGNCTKCKVVQYCSKQCQIQDWEHGGHKLECEAIQRNVPLEKLCADATLLTDERSVIGRHLTRFKDVSAHLDQKLIGPRFGGGGRGGFGGGGRGWGARPMRWGGSGWGRWGPSIGRARFGPIAYAMWGGRRIPWMFFRGFYVPWWFVLPPYYYASGIPYGQYGVPPYPPGEWGDVPPPPDGAYGYR